MDFREVPEVGAGEATQLDALLQHCLAWFLRFTKVLQPRIVHAYPRALVAFKPRDILRLRQKHPTTPVERIGNKRRFFKFLLVPAECPTRVSGAGSPPQNRK